MTTLREAVETGLLRPGAIICSRNGTGIVAWVCVRMFEDEPTQADMVLVCPGEDERGRICMWFAENDQEISMPTVPNAWCGRPAVVDQFEDDEREPELPATLTDVTRELEFRQMTFSEFVDACAPGMAIEVGYVLLVVVEVVERLPDSILVVGHAVSQDTRETTERFKLRRFTAGPRKVVVQEDFVFK